MSRLLAMAVLLCAALAGCSILTDPDEFSFVEAAPETPCGPDDVCPGATRCPRLGEAVGGVDEVQSSCYIGCAADPGACVGTDYPYCFPESADAAVCLAGARLEGGFSCPATAFTEPDSGLSLVLGEDDPVLLDACALDREPAADLVRLRFTSRTADRKGRRHVVWVTLPARDFLPGERLTDLTALAVRTLGERDAGVDGSQLVALFPPEKLSSRPRLPETGMTIAQGTLDKNDGEIAGRIAWDGLDYTAGIETEAAYPLSR